MGLFSKLFGKKKKESFVLGKPFYGQPTYVLSEAEEQMVEEIFKQKVPRGDTRTSKLEPLHLHFVPVNQQSDPNAVTLGVTDLVFLNGVPSDPENHFREMNVLLNNCDDSIFGFVTPEDCQLYHNSMELGTIGCPFAAFTYRRGNMIVGEALVLTESSVHSKGEHNTIDVLKEFTRIALQRLKYITNN
ncbi:MAG: hypothetical protein HDR87_02845 [Bacteroides sp.]|nr:hypothetical protein [Bacteroides sp.]